MKPVDYRTTPSNGGGSSAIWGQANVLEGLRPGGGVHYYFSDFNEGVGGWEVTQATAGTMTADNTGATLQALVDCGSTTATQGANCQLGLQVKPVKGTKICFEARVKVEDSATGPELFVGLAELDTSIVASSAVSTANHVGFSSITDNNVLLFNAEKATAGSTEASTTLVESTFVNLGFVIDGTDSVTQYVNGVETGSGFTSANIPIVALAPSLVCQSGGTTDPILHVDWIGCYQSIKQL